MINETVECFNDELDKKAQGRVIEKLEIQGIDFVSLADEELEELITDEKEILKGETQKIGIAAGISLGISLLIGI